MRMNSNTVYPIPNIRIYSEKRASSGCFTPIPVMMLNATLRAADLISKLAVPLPTRSDMGGLGVTLTSYPPI